MDKLHYEIKKSLETAYRRGYSHGFSMGNSTHQDSELMREILKWRNDLSIMKGAPGSSFQDSEMPWCDETCQGYQDDILIEKHWKSIEEKVMSEKHSAK